MSPCFLSALILLLTGAPSRAFRGFERTVIGTESDTNAARSVRPVDFDGDGDTDVAAAVRFGDVFSWYGSASGGGSCLIERAGRLHVLLNTRFGRQLTSLYYRL